MTTSGVASALAPIEAALRRRAHDRAATILTAAETDANHDVDAARQDAAAAIARARAEGTSVGDAAVSRTVAAARQQASERVLAAEREVYEQFRAAVIAAARALRDEPEYPQIRQRLIESACARLGPDTTIAEVEGGGVVADNRGRRLDLSLAAIAERSVIDNIATIDRLWSR